MDRQKVDRIIQYALLMAAREDARAHRTLGPIHLLKYVYLADLAYARKHDGKTYTGAHWTFYHYGPWDREVHGRIDAAAAAIGAEKVEYPSKFRDDYFRYGVASDEALEGQIEGELPTVVLRVVKSSVHEYTFDTSSLLRDVYQTPPMLSAAPGEDLDFSTAAATETTSAQDKPTLEPLSRTKIKRGQLKVRELIAARIAARREVATTIDPQRLAEARAWLDEQEGGGIAPAQGSVSFDDSVWKSGARRGADSD